MVQIVDFGFSKYFIGGRRLMTSLGTPDYIAPEVRQPARLCVCVRSYRIARYERGKNNMYT